MRCEIVRMMMIVLYLLISIWILALGSLGLDNTSVSVHDSRALNLLQYPFEMLHACPTLSYEPWIRLTSRVLQPIGRIPPNSLRLSLDQVKLERMA